jgi:hypothetical protein
MPMNLNNIFPWKTISCLEGFFHDESETKTSFFFAPSKEGFKAEWKFLILGINFHSPSSFLGKISLLGAILSSFLSSVRQKLFGFEGNVSNINA